MIKPCKVTSGLLIHFSSGPHLILRYLVLLKVKLLISWRNKVTVNFVGRRTVDFAYCRRPENRPPNDALSSGRFFDLVGFPTYVSLYIWRWSNEIDSTSGGGVNIEWRTVDRPKICVDDWDFTLNWFPTVVSTYCLLLNNKFDSPSRGGGSISNDALSIDPKSVSTTGILPWTGFPLLYQHTAYCLTTNSTVRQGGGSISNDALSTIFRHCVISEVQW